MNEKTKAAWLFLLLPFAISAAAEFLPKWISVPACVVMGLVWVGAFFTAGEIK
jgi:hypothetical protein